jgi:hypothetical protein
MLVSSAINTKQLKLPHTYNTHLLPAQIEMNPRQLIAGITKYVRAVKGTRKMLHGIGVPLLMLRYDEIVGGEGQEASKIPVNVVKQLCWFLGVDYQPMGCKLKRTNPEPLPEIISNWLEVKKALNKARLGHYLRESQG